MLEQGAEYDNLGQNCFSNICSSYGTYEVKEILRVIIDAKRFLAIKNVLTLTVLSGSNNIFPLSIIVERFKILSPTKTT